MRYKAPRKPEYWCSKCGKRLGKPQNIPNNICLTCKKKIYLLIPNVGMHGKLFLTNDHGERIKR